MKRAGRCAVLGACLMLISCRMIPNPVLTSISPDRAFSALSALTLTVRGGNFQNTSQIQFNGQAKATLFVSAGELNCTITSQDMGVTPTAGLTASVPVSVSTPQAANSNVRNFTVYLYPQFQAAKKISDSTSSYSETIRPRIGIDNAKRLSVLWRDKTSLLFSSSVDGGANWSPPKSIYNHPSTLYRFSMAVQKATGAIFVAWEEAAVAYTMKSVDYGQTWSSPLALTSGATVSAENPGLFVDASGNVLAACLIHAPPGGSYAVLILKSSDQGARFTETGRLGWTTYFTGENSPQFGQDKAGILYLVFPSDFGTRYSTTYLAFSTNGGLSWSTPNGVSMVAPSMAIDEENAANLIGANMYLPYMYKLTFKRSADRGASWAAVDFTDTTYAVSDLALNALGSTDVIWANRFVRSFDRGATWGPVLAYTDETQADRPSIVEDPSGKITIVWWNTAGGIYASVSK